MKEVSSIISSSREKLRECGEILDDLFSALRDAETALQACEKEIKESSKRSMKVHDLAKRKQVDRRPKR